MYKCRTRSCYVNSSRITINGTGPLQFCDGSAGEPRGVVSRLVMLDIGQTEECDMIVNGSALVDKQPPPMNCEDSNPRM